MRGFVLLLLPLGSLSMTCNVNATAKYYDAALAQLESKGYTFIKGDMRVTDIDTFGANPGNPYIIYEDLPGGEVDQGYWPLGLTDAVLLVTCTPTGVRYFSYRSYLFKGGGDGLVFASMGDSTNNLAIRTTTDDIIPALNGDPGNYAARAALVTTGDAQTYADISVALAYAGLANATNLDQVELSLFNGSTAYYTMLHRASVWSDENDRQAYFARHNPIYYVRAPERRAAKALPLSEQRPRGTGQSERDVNGLTEAFDQLKAGVVAHMLELGGAYNESIQCLSANLFGRDCIAENIQCLGDNPDTNYLACGTSKTMPISLQDVYVLMGTNCVATGKCTYNNAGVYYDSLKSTVITTDDRAWVGSAVAFAPNLQSDLSSNLFAIAFSRDCTPYTETFGPYCVHVTYDQVPQGETWYPVARTVMEPTTATGPLIDELILPELIKFTFPTPGRPRVP